MNNAVPATIVLVGNPNTGKTTLFNALCGARARTSNFPGSTVEHHAGLCTLAGGAVEVIDLPGVYSLELDLPESLVCADCIAGRLGPAPDAVVLVLDATNLQRNLQFASSVLRRGVPCVAALTMTDAARSAGLVLDPASIGTDLGIPVIEASGRTGIGLAQLAHSARDIATRLAPPNPAIPYPQASPGTSTCADWASGIFERAGGRPTRAGMDPLTERLDRAFTHPVLGLAAFLTTMAVLFMSIFWLAGYPMDAIDALIGALAESVRSLMPGGLLRDFLADGLIGGIGATLVFLPQIALLFFLLALLEDTGYLARAALSLDRTMRRFGLPGQAFLPLLSSHACALPGIMSTRLIPGRRDRLATILCAPFMSCTARIPVYVLLCGLLFADAPWLAGIAFAGCYALGIAAGLGTAWLLRTTILAGEGRAMVMELPPYRRPSLRTALLVSRDRSALFLRNAATVILSISVVMWWLSAFPRSEPVPQSQALRQVAEAAVAAGDELRAAELVAAAESLDAQTQARSSFAARVGDAVQPVFEPLGLDRQLTMAVLTSFLAREVFVNTVAIQVQSGDDVSDPGTMESMRAATRDDGSPLFSRGTCAALLIFYVLAMQCLPTLVLTAREAGGWRWALLQLGWMSSIAWIAGAIAFRLVAA
ncbi:MAG: ferrous iron transporter B [Planctomycetes bacterium]|nr:ferrous iron transporter B [Planctomycetota bacterium]